MMIFNKELKEIPGVTQEILDNFMSVFNSEGAEGKSYDMDNGDTLYYIKEKPYMVYRLAAVVTKGGEYYQFGIVNPYKLNLEKDTMLGIHEDSEYIKSLNLPREEEPKEETDVSDSVDNPNEPETEPKEKRHFIVAGIIIPETGDKEKDDLLEYYEQSTMGREYLIIENFNIVKLLKLSTEELGHALQVLAILVDVENKEVYHERIIDSVFSFGSVIDFIEVNNRVDNKIKERVEEIKKELSNR